MAHINYTRNINCLRRLSINNVLTLDRNSNFGIFCGSSYQRNCTALYELGTFYGKMGIVILHNDPQFEMQLNTICNMYPSVNSSNVNIFLANSPNISQNINSFYDPFYGLTESSILDILIPLNTNEISCSEVRSIRTIISDYLNIMRFHFSCNASPFGEYPYNLDLLLELTKKPYELLKKQVLSYLPSDMQAELIGRLSIDGAQQTAYNTVFSFSQELKNFFWTEKGFSNHSRLSIISTVNNRDVISIYIPESKKSVLDYIATELQHLTTCQIPYLLVENGIDLNNSEKLKKIFMPSKQSQSYYTGIISENLSSIISHESADNDLSSLFSQTQEIFVFSCSNSITAQPFSKAIGSYYRRVDEHHIDTHREPFHIFSSHSYVNAIREVNQRIIEPEELTRLNAGCLLYGKNFPIPILVDNFIL